jgi:microcompartment protein CcmK/EutM
MRLCRVLGSVTQTAKHPSYVGHTLMVVQPLAPDGSEAGTSFLAIDHVQAGPGDRVLVMSEGNGVRQILQASQLPIRSLIVAIVDGVDLAPATSSAAGAP